ncbi:hypothetical protein KO500_07780 [Cellulophaga baltica]|uniref:hypothetical protein n=1 Tax=Cellulophaga TaxID=104264 RepID=UPI001C078F37|nr:MULTISPECIES: hypothetical protein [Cellulophaga]MBU2996330.1 hypothetical protein [Cellulophaga baltica]MDO6767725.1 hypothetical protein [Cellulophaga sp. 1_MG-2023]
MILIFKVAGLHAFIHLNDNDDTDLQHCEICHLTTAVSFTPILKTETPAIPQRDFCKTDSEKNTLEYFIVFNPKHLSSYLYTRPPPLFS